MRNHVAVLDGVAKQQNSMLDIQVHTANLNPNPLTL